jgi:glycosyltransferase involved in cell wall biosynthesis
MSRPLVSIVTPSYNQAEYVEEAIRSVLEQDYEPIEYLVVDGGSTDGSVEIIKRYADRLAWWTSEQDGGQAAALNRGFGRTRGKYIGWLCSDDTLLPGAISRLVQELEREPRLILAYGDAVYTDAGSQLRDAAPSGEWNPARMVREGQVRNQQPASLYTRRGWEAAGPLDEEAWYYIDFQFTVRLAGVGGGLHVPEPLATYRIHADGKSAGDPARKAEDAIRCADRFLTSDLVPEDLRPYAREGRAAFYRIAGDCFYAALALRRARRCYIRAAALAPQTVSRHTLAATAKSTLPRPLVRRLRALRVARLQP